MDLPVTVAVVFERNAKEFQFHWEIFPVPDGSGSMKQGRERGMNFGRVVVRLRIQIQVSVGGFPAYTVPQEDTWPSVYDTIQEMKAAVQLSLHGEMAFIEAVEKILLLFVSMGSDHECHPCKGNSMWDCRPSY